MFFLVFFFNDTATTEIYTLSLHDALPIWFGYLPHRNHRASEYLAAALPLGFQVRGCQEPRGRAARSEEHTSELQSHLNLVCRLLLEKKKWNTMLHYQFMTMSTSFCTLVFF